MMSLLWWLEWGGHQFQAEEAKGSVLFTSGFSREKPLLLQQSHVEGVKDHAFSFLSKQSLVLKDYCIQNSNTSRNIIHYKGNQVYISLTLHN